MYASSSSVNPTPLDHADNQRDVHPRVISQHESYYFFKNGYRIEKIDVDNSCPLTYLSEDLQDLTPITPAMFLFEIPTADAKDLDNRDANHFRKRFRFRAEDGLVRTVKLKTQSCALIRPIQRVFPLEVSGNDGSSLPFQRIQQGDSSVNCPNLNTLKATEKPPVVTGLYHAFY
ncbi:integrase catalytic domain-containing protein [Trichonephila clavipes]|nr:integrase catalytic domain-containing protein [Trichonephila clavipes]